MGTRKGAPEEAADATTAGAAAATSDAAATAAGAATAGDAAATPSDADDGPEYERPARVIGFERDRLLPFFAKVPELFHEVQGPVHHAYQELLYTTEHAFDGDDLRHIERLFGLEAPQWANGSRAEAIALFDGMRFPDTGRISDVRAVPGLSLPVSSHYLHFFHHAYPIYDADAVRGLNALGAPIPWTKVRDADVYGLYIAAIEELRDRIPYWDVPETNVHINRILQAALTGYGRAAVTR